MLATTNYKKKLHKQVILITSQYSFSKSLMETYFDCLDKGDFLSAHETNRQLYRLIGTVTQTREFKYKQHQKTTEAANWMQHFKV